MSDRSNQMRVYLAGGLHGDWRDRVKREVPDVTWIDPRQHGLEGDPAAYTTWDVMGVARCDVLFAYLAENNPSGLGLAFEMGYAKALGKPIIYVCELTPEHERFSQVLWHSASIACISLSGGIEYLRAFVGQP
jgi:nucleoside 2-deoxyribosyltransferase